MMPTQCVVPTAAAIKSSEMHLNDINVPFDLLKLLRPRFAAKAESEQICFADLTKARKMLPKLLSTANLTCLVMRRVW
jgi:hypothetical protein